MVETLVVEPNKKDMGKAFKKDAKAVTDALMALCQEDGLRFAAKVEADGKAELKIEGGSVEIPRDNKIAMETQKVSAVTSPRPSSSPPSESVASCTACSSTPSTSDRG